MVNKICMAFEIKDGWMIGIRSRCRLHQLPAISPGIIYRPLRIRQAVYRCIPHLFPPMHGKKQVIFPIIFPILILPAVQVRRFRKVYNIVLVRAIGRNFLYSMDILPPDIVFLLNDTVAVLVFHGNFISIQLQLAHPAVAVAPCHIHMVCPISIRINPCCRINIFPAKAGPSAIFLGIGIIRLDQWGAYILERACWAVGNGRAHALACARLFRTIEQIIFLFIFYHLTGPGR